MVTTTDDAIAVLVERVRRASKAVDDAIAHRAHAEQIMFGAEAYERKAREEFNQARGALLQTAIGEVKDPCR